MVREKLHNRIRKQMLISIIVVCFVCIPAPVSAAQNSGLHARILFISSYAYDWDSVPRQLDGLNKAVGRQAKLDYIFMNTKKEAVKDIESDSYVHIASNIKTSGQYDAVILGDDAALDFALKYQKKLFDGVPLVFEGINTEAKARKAAEDPMITGVVESFPIEQTISEAKMLYPQATNVVAISDSSESGIGSTRQFYNAESVFPELKFSDIDCMKLTEEELVKKMQSYDEKTILLFMMFTEDAEGNQYSAPEAVELLAGNSNIPVFKADEVGVGSGLIGGAVISFESMAGRAGEMAIDIIKGKPMNEIPVSTAKVYTLFDKKVMDRFGIQEVQLPEGTKLLNDEPTYFEENRVLILSTLAGVLVLLAVMVVVIWDNRRRRRLLERITESEETLNAVIESTDMQFFQYYPQFHRAEQSELSQQRLGLDRVMENYPQSWFDLELVHPDSVDTMKRLFLEIDDGARQTTCDIMIRYPEGYQWQRLRATSVYNDAGKRIKAIVSIVNISEQKKMEQNYAEQLKYINDVKDETLISKGRYNITRNKVEFYENSRNEALSVKAGMTYEEALESFAALPVLQERQEELRKLMARDNLINGFHAGRTSVCIEYERKRTSTDSPFVWASTQCTTFIMPGTDEITCFVYSYDITPQVFQKSILHCLVNSAYEYMVLIDMQTGSFIVQNVKQELEEEIRNVAVRAHYNYEEAISIVVNFHLPQEERSQTISELQLAALKQHLKENDNYEFLYTDKRGDQVERKRMQYCYLGESREIILLRRSDITEIYQKEQRQLGIVQKSLRQAEKANLAKSEFLSRVSHDMRTPMNGILGIAYLAKQKAESESLQDDLGQIEQSGRFLLQLINDTLDMNKIEIGKFELRPEVIERTQLFQSIRTIIMPSARDKNIDVDIQIPTIKYDYFYVDSTRIEQIMMNILSNAVKFTPPGGNIQLHVEILSIKDNVMYNQITVKDTGIGISREFLPHVFEPFAQESSKITGQYSGTGLGMSIVKKLVELMGGTISVKSEKGVGTEFVFTFKMPIAENPEEKKQVEEKVLNAPVLEGKRVLLCEDHPVNTRIAMRILEKRGLLVEHAENGQIGVEMFRASQPGYYDAVLMDIRMPVMDGWEATGQIRALDRADAQRIPVIAMTANAFLEDRKRSWEAGMDAHLAKPVNPAELYNTLEMKIKAMQYEVNGDDKE